MTWNAVYRDSTGELLSVGTVLPEGGVARGLTVKEYAVRPDTRGMRWNPVTREFDDHTAELPENVREADIKALSVAGRQALDDAVALLGAADLDVSSAKDELDRIRGR